MRTCAFMLSMVAILAVGSTHALALSGTKGARTICNPVHIDSASCDDGLNYAGVITICGHDDSITYAIWHNCSNNPGWFPTDDNIQTDNDTATMDMGSVVCGGAGSGITRTIKLVYQQNPETGPIVEQSNQVSCIE